MESSRFDTFTRGLAASLSRRGTLGGLAAVLAMLLEMSGHGPSEAKKKAKGCRKVGKKCSHKRNRKCCSHAKCRGGRCKCTGQKKACRGKCIPKSHCCDNADCGGGSTCQGGVCNCVAGQKPCNDVCIPDEDCCTNSDCGNCESCQSGTCVSGCQTGQECVSGTCRCTTSSCSGCCATDETCQDGADRDACGMGGNPCIECPANETCPAGACVCDSPFTDCGGICVNLNNADEHCGRCDNACVGSATCQNGACKAGGSYAFVREWDGGGGTDFSHPLGIAVDSEGYVYVTDEAVPRIVKFDANGGYEADWAATGGAPLGIGAYQSSAFYVANSGSDSLQLYASDGTPAGNPWPRLTRSSPAGVGVNQNNGEIYVAIDATNAIQRFGIDGQLIAEWLSPPYSFDFPVGIAVAPDGDVFVSNNGSCEVQRFNAAGDPKPGWGSCNGPIEFDNPFGVAVDAAGDVYVCDSGNQRVLKVTADGDFIGQIGDETNFEFPIGVAVSLAGYVYVVDGGNANVQQFEPS